MLFHSFPYIFLFLPVVVIVHVLLEKHGNSRWPQIWLLVASLFFYAYGDPADLLFLAGSIVFNAMVGRLVVSRDERLRKAAVWVGVTANVVLLFSFKYVAFFLRLIPAWNVSHSNGFHWEAPLGLSFFTLIQVMYLVDTYQGLNAPNSLFDHATLTAAFPYVSSGPLVQSRLMVPQFSAGAKASALRKEHSRVELICRGLYIFAIGLAKKVVITGAFATVADSGFGLAQPLSCVEAWIFSLAFTFQVYFDFSGYSDMAVGSALMLGLDIPQNFNAPYRSKSITEFWQRWHISLSNFITNYLFTPIVRSMGRVTLVTSVIATILAMGIAGLWHGASWTFVVFGLIHGAALGGNQIWKRRKLRMPDWCGWVLTFLMINTTFVLFRSADVPSAWKMIAALVPHGNLFGTAALSKIGGVFASLVTLTALPAVVGGVIAFFFETSSALTGKFRATPLTMAATAFLLFLSILFMNGTVAKKFIYFAF